MGVREPDGDFVGVTEGDVDGEDPRLGVADGVDSTKDCEGEEDIVFDDDGEIVGDLDRVLDGVVVGVAALEAVVEPDPPVVMEEVDEAVTEGDFVLDTVDVADRDDVSVADGVGELDGVFVVDGDCESPIKVTDVVGVTRSDVDGEDRSDEREDDGETVDDLDSVLDGVVVGVAAREAVDDPEPPAVIEEVEEAVAEGESVLDGVLVVEGVCESPIKDTVGVRVLDRVTEGETDFVCEVVPDEDREGVLEDVPDEETDGVIVNVGEGDFVLLEVRLAVWLGVSEALAPRLKVAVGDAERVGVKDAVVDLEGVPVRVMVTVADTLAVADGVGDIVRDGVCEPVCDRVLVTDVVGDIDADAPAVTELVGVAELEGVFDAVPDCEPVCVIVPVGLGVNEGVGEHDGAVTLPTPAQAAGHGQLIGLDDPLGQ